MSSTPSPHLSNRERAAIRMIPFIVGCALFMQMLDATVVATAIPAMAAALDTTPVKMNVAITSYLLALAVFVPISGWAGERFGARKVFIVAIVLFSAASVACALSQNLPQLVIARLFQGLAGAMMVPVGRIIMLQRTPKEDLLKAMSFLAMPALLGPIIGPPLGGFLVTYASWHWIFLINVPVGALGIYLIMKYIRPDLPAHARRLDWLGFMLSGIALATLVWGFESIGNADATRLQTLGLISIGASCGLLYVWHARHHPHPILDLSLLRIPSFAISVLGGNLCRFTVGATPFLLAILLQVAFDMSAFAAGLISFTGAAGALLMKFIATRVIETFGYKRVLTINALISGGFTAACAFFEASTPFWVMVAILAVGGVFRSLQFTAVNTLTYAQLTSAQMSKASTFAAMAQQLGISLGVGCAALIMNISMNARGAATLAQDDVAWAFAAIGAITALSFFSFIRLPANAAEQLHQKKRP
ncbi:DHA2 family efflux MFS transporter permease subunit [Pusillimonas sp. 7-48]|uniref:DHA2 family efflux MFS transporter permease subunit n=2 Tax=Pusillimonas minor TaxID=2697024 RepID=A0A842HSU5_9BURK|nr:DHA2 family efflux MFS transporter permease subunit [Pusillimonas minor]MBC2770718.1 DHA2 family efflux MFS transporter permease subunit [Pusillimonas minor]